MKQRANPSPRTSSTYIVLVATALLAVIFSPRAEAEPYVPVEGVLEDRAFLFELEKGIRRVRMQIKDPETGRWGTHSVAHLRGDEMFFKVRIPDDVEVDDCRVHTSKSDPFPYSFYDGNTTTYSEIEGTSSPTSVTATGTLSVLDSATSFSRWSTPLRSISRRTA